MKTYILIALLALGSSLSHAQLAPDVAKLKQQFDTDSAAALKPVVLRYASQLEVVRRVPLHRGDAPTAAAVEEALTDLRSKTTVSIPASPAAAAVAGPTPAPPT